jgi:hypothetical protein
MSSNPSETPSTPDAPTFTEELAGVIQIGCTVIRDAAGNIVRREVTPGQMQVSGSDIFDIETPEGLLRLQDWCLMFAASAGQAAVAKARQQATAAPEPAIRVQGYNRTGQPL